VTGRAWQPTDDPHDLVRHHTVYSCVVGSRAYGLDGPVSDTDRRGVFAAPTPLYWGLHDPPTHVDGPAEEQFSWELRRCCELALAGNPTVLECLWSPLVERITDVGRELLAVRPAFLSTRLAQTYGGYAQDQLSRLSAVRERTGEIKWKQAMHMVRLLMAGAHVLRTGEVLVDVSAHRARLIAVRAGDLSWEAVSDWAVQLREDLAAAEAATPLPVEPDRPAVADFLFRTRRSGALL
jgi:predicted nucleotidyltransferase